MSSPRSMGIDSYKQICQYDITGPDLLVIFVVYNLSLSISVSFGLKCKKLTIIVL